MNDYLDKMSGLYGFKNDKLTELTNRQVLYRMFCMVSLVVGLLSLMTLILFLLSKLGPR